MLYCQTRKKRISMTDSVMQEWILMQDSAAVPEALAVSEALKISLICSAVHLAEDSAASAAEAADARTVREREAIFRNPSQLISRKRLSVPRKRFA